MSRMVKKEIEDSWSINENTEGDGDISWAEETDPSDTEEQYPTSKNSTPSKSLYSIQSYTSSRQPSSSNQPHLIMPKLSEKLQSKKSVSSKPATISTPAPTSRKTSRSHPAQHKPQSKQYAESLGNSILEVSKSTMLFLLDIVVSTFRVLKHPISWVLAAYCFAGLLVLVQNLLTSSITSALSPVCRIPGVSLLNLPICRYQSTSYGQPSLPANASVATPVEFDDLIKIQGNFETILEESAMGVQLTFDMKKSETSIRDLRQLVTHSSIPAKNELVYELTNFLETARTASQDLPRFNSHVGRAVDSVLSVARWTERSLNIMALEASSSNNGIVGYIKNKVFAPFLPLQFNEARLTDEYVKYTRHISDHIESLIQEAQALLMLLMNLEDRLETIHEISLRSGMSVQASRDKILESLWTYVGGNSAKLDKHDKQLNLLGQVGMYRKYAYAHISGTILKLQSMSAGLEDLRTRVGSAAMEADAGIKGVPLDVHIETIRLGVERLQGYRQRDLDYRRQKYEEDRDRVDRQHRGLDSGPLPDAILLDAR